MDRRGNGRIDMDRHLYEVTTENIPRSWAESILKCLQNKLNLRDLDSFLPVESYPNNKHLVLVKGCKVIVDLNDKEMFPLGLEESTRVFVSKDGEIAIVIDNKTKEVEIFDLNRNDFIKLDLSYSDDIVFLKLGSIGANFELLSLVLNSLGEGVNIYNQNGTTNNTVSIGVPVCNIRDLCKIVRTLPGVRLGVANQTHLDKINDPKNKGLYEDLNLTLY